jgi:RNA polymerase sigma factor (TIGR02999 family)
VGNADDLTRMLRAAGEGDVDAEANVLSLIYDELRRMAEARMRKTPPGQTLQATALVHEAYLRIIEKQQIPWDGRRHFFFAAGRAMRDILVEHARRRNAQKRGGARQRIELRYDDLVVEADSAQMLALDEALQDLERRDPQAGRLVMLRYFSDRSVTEAAELMQISISTAERKWRFARAWLQRALIGDSEDTEHDAG